MRLCQKTRWPPLTETSAVDDPSAQLRWHLYWKKAKGSGYNIPEKVWCLLLFTILLGRLYANFLGRKIGEFKKISHSFNFHSDNTAPISLGSISECSHSNCLHRWKISDFSTAAALCSTVPRGPHFFAPQTRRSEKVGFAPNRFSRQPRSCQPNQFRVVMRGPLATL